MKTPISRGAFLAAVTALALTAALPAHAADRFITVASTTSTENSGLFKAILRLFTRATGIEVRVVAQGTGQALRTARNGDADVVFVHARAAEEKFVADGYGVKRNPVMFNDFIIVGPKADPAKVASTNDAPVALAKIAAANAPFTSRGDDSGTHKAERRLWQAAGVAPEGKWYRETGSGMGATLNIAAQMNAYALTDRSTWLAFENKGALKIAVEGDKRLFNQYGVILVNPQKDAHVKAAAGQAFIDWVTGPAGQKAIAGFRVGGQQPFFPNAGEPGA